MKKSTLTDAERASQAHMAYPVSPITAVDGNTGDWISTGRPQELENGLELYTLQKPGTKEVVFVFRGSDCNPKAAADWSPTSGANVAFAGSLHPQLQEAIRYINKFMEDHEGEGLIYSTTGHSKGGGFAQVIAHTFGIEGTALDPAPAGSVVEGKEYLDYVHSLGITPQGIPEHGFTSYVVPGRKPSIFKNSHHRRHL